MNPDLSRSVWHTAISFDSQDEARLQANPQLMQQVASDYVQGMGLDQSQVRGNPSPGHRPQPFSHHCQSGGQRRANRQRQPQLQPARRNYYAKSSNAINSRPCRSRTSGSRLTTSPKPTAVASSLRDQVRASLSRCVDSRELRDELSRHGIRLIVNQGEQGQTRGAEF